MKKKILFLCLYLCVSLMSIAQNALCVYPKSGVDSLPIAFRVFARMAYYEDSLDITHRSGWLLYAAPYDDIQHIAFINHQPTYTSVYDTICSGETYTWNGNTYSRPGVYVDTLQNIYGCDSIVELRLEVLPDPAISFTVNGVSFNMIRVRAGSFMMGATEKDTEAEVDEFPRHEVTLTKDFFIGETEMTQELWSAIMGSNPSEDKSNPQSPVNMVTWDDCQQMIVKLNQLTGLTFRLPTEAEWEYAARGGQYSKGYKYAGSDNIDEVAWYNGGYYYPVAQLKPNELGLFDMSGNVYEWCQDQYHDKAYTSTPCIDPLQLVSSNGMRCVRGGSNSMAQSNREIYTRIANRGNRPDNYSKMYIGLRLALEATGILEDNSVFVTYDTICSGETYTWNGEEYTRPGVYTDTLQNIYGCDSIVELRLEVLPDPAISFTVNGVSFNMIRVRAGSFMMGATPEQGDDALENEKPAHQVTLTRDYFIAETMLTQELWTAVMGTTIQEEEAKRSRGEENLGYGPNYPMYCLSHNDCLDFVEKLNDLTGLTFRMPTEAEWEYAARGGHLSKGYKYPGSNDPLEVAWSDVNAPDCKLREVKLLKPNELGVYDMAGNVWEYIYDYRRTYTADAQVDPLGDIDGNMANIRGGSTAWDTRYNRVSCRYAATDTPKTDKSSRRAFRFVLDADRVIGEDNTTYQVYDTICAGETYTWNGNTYSRPGVYVDTLQNIYGCDSIVELRLEVLPDPALTFTVNGVSFNMMRVRAGSFMMGATEKDTIAEIDEFPLHQVTLTRDYFIAETEMTQELWSAIMGSNPSADKSNPQSPVNMVTWDDCQQMIVKLNELTGLTFRLPTEAEWEYAARGGQYSKGYKYAGSDNIDEVAWYNKSYYASVASLKPNELGLYDMSGSVYEWCQDYFNPNFYSSPNHQVDPFQAESVDGKWCLRGGSNEASQGDNQKFYSRIANRGYGDGTKVSSADGWGLRLALEATGILENNSVFVTNDTICSGDVYVWNGKKYYYSGNYVDTLQNIYGCDSIVELHLTVHSSYNNHETVVACGSYEFNPFNIEGGGRILSESGIYSDTIATIHGCDSIATIDLTVMPEAVTTTEKVVIGSNELPYVWRNSEYNESGTYIDEYKYVSTECDSAIHYLELTVLTTGAIDEQTKAVCESALPYEWYGQSLIATGSYTHTEQYVGTTIDSVQHILHFVVNLTQYSSELKTICFGESYTWNGNIYTSSDDYTVTLSDKNGCDSVVTLHLTVLPKAVITTEKVVIGSDELPYIWRGKEYNISGTYTDKEKFASAECDSAIHYLELIVLTTGAIDEQTKAVCESALPYEWYGQELIATGSYTHTEQYVGTAIDSVQHILHFVVNPTQYSSESKTICFGESYTWNGNIYTSSDDYTVTLSDKNGCDSVVTLHLTVLPEAVITTEKVVIGSNELPYIWRGKEYNASGTYTDKEKFALAECDSAIYVLELTVLTTGAIDEQTKAVCESALPYEWYGQELTSTGSYSHIEQYVGTEIDSVQHILHFVVNPTLYSNESKTICFGESYTWNGNIYTSSDDYTVTLSDKNGCDSVVTLHLTVLPEAVITTDTAVIGSDELPYIWRGQQYAASGTYTDKELFASTECDSAIHYLELTVLTTGAIDEQTKAVCESALPYEWYGQSLIATGSYSHIEQYVGTAIDSVEHILHFVVNPTLYSSESKTICFGESYTWNGNIYTSSADYTVTLSDKNGCDSVVTLHLAVLPEVVITTEKVVIGSNELPYIWRGKEYNASGTYTDNEKFASAECDSAIHYLELTVLTTGAIEEDTLAVCESALPYEWYGQSLIATGPYTHTEQYVGTAIDSVEHILHFVVNPTQYSSESKTICFGESYTWNGNIYTSSDDYTVTLSDKNGCDSIVTLHLTVLPKAVITTDTAVIGSNELPYIWRGKEYNISGTYTDKEKFASAECDSAIHYLELTVLTTGAIDEQTKAVCESALPYEWYGQELTSTGSYTHTEQYVGTAIDSVQHILHFVVNPTLYSSESKTICFGESYTWNGNIYTSSDDYTVTLSDKNGCDSVVTLHLTVLPKAVITTETAVIGSNELPYIWRGKEYNISGTYTDKELFASTECDSAIHYLELTVLTTGAIEEDTVIVCESALPYEWYGQNLIATGSYSYIEQYVGTEIDSVQHILHFVINPTQYSSESKTICFGESYAWNGNIYTSSDDYTVTLSDKNGCDSVVTLHLIVLPEAVITTDTAVIGSNELPYIWRGKEYNISGTYTDKELFASAECDSAIHYLELTVLTTGAIDEQTKAVCESALPYEWYGQSLTATGSYTHTEQYVGTAIDSVQHILHFVVNPIYVKEEFVTECDSYTWSNGNTYTESGIYYDSLKTIYGCDSVVTLYLTINHTSYFAYDTAVCGSYLFVGEELIESGTYIDTIANAAGCDSIITLNLTIYPITPIEYIYDTICSDELPYIFNDLVYDATGVYTHTYQNQYGCDSTIVLMLEVVERLVVEVDSLPTLCADDGELVINYDVLQGEFDSLQIRFVNDTVPAELYTQTIYENSISEVVYTFDSTIWVDRYIVQLEFYQNSACGNQVFELPFDIQYDASIIVQKWNTFLALQNANYNGGYTFTEYQWYKNDEPIPGATKASLHQDLDSMACYHALLTRDDGLVMRTCDYCPTLDQGFPEFPTLVKSSQHIYVTNTAYTSPIETITIYSEVGQLISVTKLVNGEGDVIMPFVEGNYITKIQTMDGQIISQMLVVLW